MMVGMSDDLVAFVRARLDDVEQVARTACEYAEAEWKLDEEFGETVLWWPPEPRVAEKERQHGLPVVSDQWRGQTIASGGTRIAPHIARHDPARVLADVEAKRRIVETHARLGDLPFCETCDAPSGIPGRPLGCDTLRLLALPYAGHPGYREEWRP